jgi:hypothetical protein
MGLAAYFFSLLTAKNGGIAHATQLEPDFTRPANLTQTGERGISPATRHSGETMTKPIEIKVASDTPHILITAEDAENMTGGGYGPTVADIDVLNADGTYSRFFITIGINERNQAVCEVATNRRNLQVVRKTVTATRRDPMSDHPTMGD